jgi:hypothetical protein
MSLLERLKNERDACVERYKRLERNLEVCKRELEKCDAEWGEFNVAIVALDPPRPSDFSAEKETAREQLEREPEIEPVPSVENVIGWNEARASGFEGSFDDYMDVVEHGHHQGDDTPPEHISILTGDPAIEPEAGLHGEPTDLQGDTVPELQQAFDEIFGAQEERPALNEQMQDEREQGYAHVTNPEADALARAHDYYSPEKVAERNRFNPFAMFRREPEGV